MNPKQALGQASLTVGLPILVLGGLFLYLFRPAGGEEWSVYVAVLLFPFLLLLPLIYRNYRRGAQPASAKRQWVAGVFFVLSGAAYAIDAFLTPGDKWRLTLRFSIAIVWLAGGVLQLKRARMAASADTVRIDSTEAGSRGLL